MKRIHMKCNRLVTKHLYVVAIALVVVFLTDYACPIRLKSGVPCFSCGITRAWIALLMDFDIHKAFMYHPLFIFIPIYIWFLIHYDKDIKILVVVNKNIKRAILLTGGLVILIVYLIRLLSGSIL